MTTNHPAHGPVSLERLSLNDAIAHADERADALSGPCSAQHAQLAAWLRELQERRKADAVKVIDDAIAAFEEQDNPRPVMAVKGELGFIEDLEKIIEERDEDIDIGQLGCSNYDALKLAALDAFRASLPAPVVPEPKSYMDFWEQYPDMTVQDSIERSAGWNACRAAMLQAGNSPVTQDGLAAAAPSGIQMIPDGYVMVPKEPTAKMYDAGDQQMATKQVWDAMIAAAPQPQNSPQNIPEIIPGWIPVSERMPEVGVKVLCFPVEDEPIHASFNGQLWLQDISWSVSDESIDNVISCNVTHWMPLPASPQQEVKS
ncbi:TPA: DUF551 domain-containing protein [Citrobacter murliniae]